MRIIVFYDEEICDAEVLVKNFTTRLLDRRCRCIKNRDEYVIRYDEVEIVFTSLIEGRRGMRGNIILVPEHTKDSSIVKQVVRPICLSDIFAYYDQMIFKEKE